MRPACPPLVCGCKFLNFSRSKSEMDLAGRKSLADLEGDVNADITEYAKAGTDQHTAMVEGIRKRLGLTTLRYQTLGNMIEAIGLPREKLCTFCWNGESLYENE